MIESNLVAAIFSRITNYFNYFFLSLLIKMDHNHYDNDTDNYYNDDSDTLIMDLSEICNKLDDSKDKNESLFRVQNGSPGSTRFYGPVHLRRSVYTREASEIFKLSGC